MTPACTAAAASTHGRGPSAATLATLLLLHRVCLQAFLKVNGPVLQLPQAVTDITTAQTIIHLAAPDLTLVLDPLL